MNKKIATALFFMTLLCAAHESHAMMADISAVFTKKDTVGSTPKTSEINYGRVGIKLLVQVVVTFIVVLCVSVFGLQADWDDIKRMEDDFKYPLRFGYAALLISYIYNCIDFLVDWLYQPADKPKKG